MKEYKRAVRSKNVPLILLGISVQILACFMVVFPVIQVMSNIEVLSEYVPMLEKYVEDKHPVLDGGLEKYNPNVQAEFDFGDEDQVGDEPVVIDTDPEVINVEPEKVDSTPTEIEQYWNDPESVSADEAYDYNVGDGMSFDESFVTDGQEGMLNE